MTSVVPERKISTSTPGFSCGSRRPCAARRDRAATCRARACPPARRATGAASTTPARTAKSDTTIPDFIIRRAPMLSMERLMLRGLRNGKRPCAVRRLRGRVAGSYTGSAGHAKRRDLRRSPYAPCSRGVDVPSADGTAGCKSERRSARDRAPRHARARSSARLLGRGSRRHRRHRASGIGGRARNPRSARPAVGVDRQRRFARPRSALGRACRRTAARSKILVAIADVDALVKQGSRDRRARADQHDVGLHGGRASSRCCRRSSRPISRRSARARSASPSSSR